MKTINEVFIEAVKAALDGGEHGTQVDVARRLGLSRGAFNNKVSGRRGTTEEFRRAVCDALNINYEDIIKEARPPLSKEGAEAVGKIVRGAILASQERQVARAGRARKTPQAHSQNTHRSPTNSSPGLGAFPAQVETHHTPQGFGAGLNERTAPNLPPPIAPLSVSLADFSLVPLYKAKLSGGYGSFET